MHNVTALALTFAVCLATTIVVAAVFRVLAGKKQSLLNIVAIPVGITLAEAARMGWHISGTSFIFVLAGAVGVSVFCAQLIRVQRGA
jgi:quercetin dioxygenase-like cupin family protein